MPKVLAISGMALSALLLLLFGLDLALKLPFGRPSTAMDIAMVVSAILLGYMGWNAYRELA